MKRMKAILIFITLWHVSLAAQETRIVMWSFAIHNRGTLEVPVELKTDYGFMVLNDYTDQKPTPHYILGDRKKGVVMHFKKKADFLGAVKQLAPGGVIAMYGQCTCPTWWGLKESDLVDDEIKKICKERKIKVSDEAFTRCVCPEVNDSER